MTDYKDRRKSKRLGRHFVVAYRPDDEESEYDLSQIKDISEGGMRFPASKKLNPETMLVIELRTPITHDKIKLRGRVLESNTVIEGLIYDTRIAFIDLDNESKELVEKTIQYFKKNHNESSKE